MVPENMADFIQDRDHDGIADYLNVRIFVPDAPSLEELTAASNVAARLAFEVMSLDLPLAYPVSAYNADDSRIPIFIGRASASATDVSSLRLPRPEDADRFVRHYRVPGYSKVAPQEIKRPEPGDRSIENLLERGPGLVLAPQLKCIAVIDLAARIAFESTCLRLPIATSDFSELPDGAILVGKFNEFRSCSDMLASLPHGHGRIQVMDQPDIGTITVICGADEAGEAAAIRYAAQRLPFVWDYGKSHPSLEAVAVDIRRQLTHSNVHTDMLIFEKIAHLAWEVDAALRRIEEVVVPRIGHGSRVEVEFRLSEPPAVRQVLREKIVERLIDCGANPALAEVKILSAYKQGFCWISETLMSQLKGAYKICIRFRPLRPGPGSVDSPIRWLQELYPVDEVLARDLGIPPDHITFDRLPDDAAHIYEVLVEDAAGGHRIAGTFDPRYVTQPLFDRFPDYGHALVTTGCIRALVDGMEVIDERIETDPEQFWAWYQKEILAGVADHLVSLYGGTVDPRCSPHFGSLEIDLELSEPDYKIGIDEERISTLEALHEDIYFETLLFLDVLGQTNCNRRLAYGGRIIPRIRTSTDGPGSVHVRLTGKQEPGVPWREIETPKTTGIEVAAGRRGIAALEFRVDADCEHLNRVDLSYADIVAISLIFNDHTVTIQDGSVPNRTTAISAPSLSPEATGMVQWTTPIGPEECEQIIKKLASFPEIQGYPVGRSYLGHTIWAMDVKTAVKGQYFSQAKASLEKAVLLITGRQHANEVSSTSHILRLAELLANDTEYKKLLQRVIFVLHPMTNPDGAQLVDELRQINPGLMLHAGYLGALGVDVTDRYPQTNPIYPEAEVRPWLVRTWKPSLVLNPHGYPSHEWVQLFAGYSAWVRSCHTIARDWWIPRGWFIPRLAYTEAQKEWALALLVALSDALDPVTGALNERMRRRYRKYGSFDEATYQMSFQGNLLVHAAQNDNLQANEPLEIVTEVPDEVAEGGWLHGMAQAGLECSLATARFLSEWSVPAQRLYAESTDETLFCIRRLFAFAKPES